MTLRRHRFPLLLLSLLLAASILTGGGTHATPLSSTSPAAVLGGPDCGPSLLWVCSGGGQEVSLDATVCEKFFFERETGLTCVPTGL